MSTELRSPLSKLAALSLSLSEAVPALVGGLEGNAALLSNTARVFGQIRAGRRLSRQELQELVESLERGAGACARGVVGLREMDQQFDAIRRELRSFGIESNRVMPAQPEGGDDGEAA